MLKIRIETKNDAFREDLEKEIKECLERVMTKISLGHRSYKLYDSNGNLIGNFKLTNR